MTLPGDELPLGHLHPITQARRQIEDAFVGLGYEVRDDREVEWSEVNFDLLAFEPSHPARSPRATFFLEGGDRVLRTETSPSQIHHLREREPPVYMVSIGRVYRRDAIDATHYPIFHQFEGLAIDKGITLADLKGTLLHVMRAIFGAGAARPLPHALLPVHRAVDRAGRLVRHLRRRRLPHLPLLRLARDGRLRHGRPARARERRPRPRGVGRLRVRLRDRARRAAALGLPRHPRPLGGRPPRPPAILMRVPVAGCASTSPVEMPLAELAERLSVATAEVEGIEQRGVADADGNLGLFRVGKVLEAVKHPNADRLQLTKVDVGEGEPRQIVCGAWNFGAGATVAVALPGAVLPNGLAARAAQGARRALRRDDPRRGRGRPRPDHAGIMLLPETEPGTPLADVLPLADRVLLRRVDRQPPRPAVRLRPGPRDRGPLRPAARGHARAPDDRDMSRADGSTIADRGPRGLPALHRPALPRASRSGRRRVWLKARLLAAGMRPISNVVDVTNYVMLALGNPLHAFDHDSSHGGRIVVRRAAAGREAAHARRRRARRSTRATC